MPRVTGPELLKKMQPDLEAHLGDLPEYGTVEIRIILLAGNVDRIEYIRKASVKP